MRAALYVRVSTDRQQHAQTIEQQVTQLRSYVAAHQGWTVAAEHVFRDDGYSGAKLDRPGLDALRDQAARAAFDVVLVTAPDRLARNFVHQMVVLEELERRGVRVVFIDRPLSDDPHEQLVTQIRGAVAEYERTLIADRMRRGRQARLRSGQLLPWTRAPYGYRLHPERPRDPAAVQLDPVAAAIVQELFAAYAAGGVTLHTLAAQLTARGVPTPTGRPIWRSTTIRNLLTNPAYKGQAASGRLRTAPARRRWSALAPVGKGASTRVHPPQEWITVPVPALVAAEQFDLVARRLAANQRAARRSTTHPYLLRGLISCGVCRLSCSGVTRTASDTRYRYYRCRGKQARVSSGRASCCPARFIPASQLDELVWADLCAVLEQPQLVAQALQRAHSGAWVPKELRRRQATLRSVRASVARQRQRLLEAYLAEVIDLAAFQRQDRTLAGQEADLLAREREVAAQAQRLVQVSAIARSMTAVLEQLRAGLDQASFEQRRQLVELLIDRVVVTDGQVEIRYVIPTTPGSTKTQFCHLRTDYFQVEPADIRPPDKVQIELVALWAGPPQPQHLGRPRLDGDPLDLDADDRAAHDRPRSTAAVARMALLLGMQPGPGVHRDGAVLIVLTDQGGGRGRPGGRVGAVELGPVATRPAALGGALRWWWVGVEAAIRAQPHQHRHGQVREVERQLGGVVAGVEDKQRHRLAGGQPGQQRPDLRGGGLVGVLQGVQAAGIHRGGPRVTVEAELADPLEGPAGDDRLTGRVARGMVVVATRRGAFGVAAWPGGHVHGEHRRVGGRQHAHQQVAQPLGIDLTAGQGGVDAAPAAPVDGFQAQVRQRQQRRLGAQQRIGEVEQRIGAAGKAGVQLSSERTKPNEGEGWHRHGRAA
jgi:site-specific DNA recombinase